jgi:hypothetical protein
MTAQELFASCKNLGLEVYRKKHPLNAGKIIIAYPDGDVAWAGDSVPDALTWVQSLSCSLGTAPKPVTLLHPDT